MSTRVSKRQKQKAAYVGIKARVRKELEPVLAREVARLNGLLRMYRVRLYWSVNDQPRLRFAPSSVRQSTRIVL